MIKLIWKNVIRLLASVMAVLPVWPQNPGQTVWTGYQKKGEKRKESKKEKELTFSVLSRLGWGEISEGSFYSIYEKDIRGMSSAVLHNLWMKRSLYDPSKPAGRLPTLAASQHNRIWKRKRKKTLPALTQRSDGSLKIALWAAPRKTHLHVAGGGGEGGGDNTVLLLVCVCVC